LYECPQRNELKISTSLMNTVAAWNQSEFNTVVEQMPIIGGYAGGVEETAICEVASTLASFAVLNADLHLGGPIHIRWGTTTNRQSLQVSSHTAMAIDTNTDLLIADQYYTMAGPCTEMNLMEIAAQAMCDTATGREMLSGVASAKGVRADMVSGMEARMMGNASMAVCGMDVNEVNQIVDRIVAEYEGMYTSAPEGLTFRQCYVVDDVEPTEEYRALFDGTLDKFDDLGISF